MFIRNVLNPKAQLFSYLIRTYPIYVLDEMIFAFETKVGDLTEWEDQFHTGNMDIQWKTLEDGMSEMVHGPEHTNEIDWEGRKAFQARITNGFSLFGKYYENLWD